jgi:Cof subfamily protein (haloacid dehalogenase superfamily)
MGKLQKSLKFEGVILACDFDNTLIYTEAALRTGQPVPPLSQGNRYALESFMAQGGLFTIATGRALAAFEKLAPLVPMNAPCVVCNGAAIYDFSTKQYLETALLPENTLARGQSILDRFPNIGVEAYHVNNIIHAVHINTFIRNHEHLTGVQVQERPTLSQVPLPLSKLLFEGPNTDLLQAEAFIRAQPWLQEYELIFSGKTLLELTAKGATKGGMLLKLAALLNVKPENTYAAGDERNDISMLQIAALAFAPANCAPAVKKTGATLVRDAREDALAEIIQILEGRYSGAAASQPK